MYYKRVLKHLLYIELVAALATAAICYWLESRTLLQFVNVSSCVGLGLGGIGALIMQGNGYSSKSAMHEDMALSVASDPDTASWWRAYDRWLAEHQSVLLIIGGVLWLGMTALTYNLLH